MLITFIFLVIILVIFPLEKHKILNICKTESKLLKKKMKKILITGGAGYIGSMLSTELIKLGHKVTVIDDLRYSEDSINHLFFYENFKFIKGDVRNKKLINLHIKKNEIIIPLAGLVGAPLCEKNKKEAQEVNFDCVKHILSVIKKNQKIIYMNTNSGYGYVETECISSKLQEFFLKISTALSIFS